MIKYMISYDMDGKQVTVSREVPGGVSWDRVMRNGISHKRKYSKEIYPKVKKKLLMNKSLLKNGYNCFQYKIRLNAFKIRQNIKLNGMIKNGE